MFFYGQSSDQMSSNRRVETGNPVLSCPQHLRPICPPLNPMECEIYKSMAMMFWLPQTETALAQVVA
jgi:hypothetical protein